MVTIRKVVDNPYLSRILYLISSGINVNKEIGDYLKLYPSGVNQQIKKILKEDYLTCKQGNIRNKKIYSIKWEKITSEFLDYFRKELRKAGVKEHKEETKLFERLIKNDILIFLFKDLFKSLNNSKHSLKYIFNNYLISGSSSTLARIYKKENAKYHTGEAHDFHQMLLLCVHVQHYYGINWDPQIDNILRFF